MIGVISKTLMRDHLFSTYAKFFKKLTFPTPWGSEGGGAGNVSFSENFA